MLWDGKDLRGPPVRLRLSSLTTEGVSDDLHRKLVFKLTFFVRSVLMTDDLPTLGYPTNPTEMYFLSDLRRESCRSRLRRLPFPKGLVMLAWNARVGNSLLRYPSHLFVTQAGTYSFINGQGYTWCVEKLPRQLEIHSIHAYLTILPKE